MTFQRARSPEQRAERRRSILDTASVMLAEMPVADVTLNELARRVGLAKSNVLRYFDSREAVLLELLHAALQEWLDALRSDLPAAVDSTGPAERAEDEFGHAHVGDLDVGEGAPDGHWLLLELVFPAVLPRVSTVRPAERASALEGRQQRRHDPRPGRPLAVLGEQPDQRPAPDRAVLHRVPDQDQLQIELLGQPEQPVGVLVSEQADLVDDDPAAACALLHLLIEQEAGGEDVFVHHSAILADGYRTLKEGQAVDFEISKEAKGLRAANVRVSD